jgi:hypothetical protein
MAQTQRLSYGTHRALNSVRHGHTLERLTRIGFVAKGVVYLMVGTLALMAAFGNGGETTDNRGVLTRIASEPFGEFAVAVLGIGLLAYAAWRFFCAITDSENEGTGAKAIAKRVGYLASSVVHVSAGIFALRLLTSSGGGGGNGAQSWSARLLSAPGGEVLLAAAGVALFVAGAAIARDGWKEKFVRHMGALSGHEWVRSAGKWGYIARGVVFGLMGSLVVTAALRHDPTQVRGLEGALDTLASQPFGQWLLAFVAAGLACYGLFCFVEARYRRVNV